MSNTTINLTENISIPQMGFGTWGLDKGKEEESIEYALEVGYRHIDTADFYGTHKFIPSAIKRFGIQREEVFITTKLWKDSLTADKVNTAVKRFLDELDTYYIDLLLIHRRDNDVPLRETLEAMNAQKIEGRVKAIGVSNFRKSDIEEALETGIQILNNQIEQHPSLNEEEFRKFCIDNGIQITAYSPLARGEDLKLDVIKELADQYDKHPAQIVLNWILSRGMVAIPKSSDKDHIKSNFESMDFEMKEVDIERINEIDKRRRIEDK